MKNQTQFPHKNFLLQNTIDIEKLPEDLRKRIYGFEDLEQDLSATIGSDRERLLDRMENLSHDIDEDLEESFEDHITNNDEQEENEESFHKHSAQEPHHECACKHAKKIPIVTAGLTPTEGLSAPAGESLPTTQAHSDEQILKKLLQQGRTTVLPDDLMKLGYKGPLQFRIIAVGSLYLRKSKYDAHFQIIMA